MGKGVTFGRRYNLTGKEPVTRNEYVSTFAGVVGATDLDIRNVPKEQMDTFWDGEVLVDLGDNTGMSLATRSTSSGSPAPNRSRGRQRFQLSQLVQHLAPNIHRWDQSTVFSIDRLRTDIGWEPEHTFASMVDDTYRWWSGTDLPSQEHDWTFEDNLLAEL